MIYQFLRKILSVLSGSLIAPTFHKFQVLSVHHNLPENLGFILDRTSGI